jgi:hypothetical protein
LRFPRQETYVIVIWAVIAVGEPGWFGIGCLAQLSRSYRLDSHLLAFKGPNLKPLILWLLEDLLSMKAVEDPRGILTRYLFIEEYIETTGVEVGKAREVVDARVNDNPLGIQ